MRSVRSLVVLVLCVAVAACASMRRSGSPRTKTVTMKNFAFDPDDIEISLGDTVQWENQDSFTHSAVADNKSFDTGNVPGEERRAVVPKAKGEWPYHCSWHPNMRAKIIVK